MMQRMDVAAALQSGLANLQAGRLDQAEAVFRSLLATHPNDLNALHLLGLVAHRRGRHAEAVELISRAAVLAPRAAEIHNNLAEALRLCGRLDDAVAEYRVALSLKPDFVAAAMNLGLVLMAQHDFPGAEACFRHATQLAPVSFAHNQLGESLYRQGKFAEAAAQYRESIRLSMTVAAPYANLADALAALGQTADAIAMAERATELAPDEPAYRVTLGNILLANGTPAEAAKHYERALDKLPNEGAIWFNYAAALRSLGRLDEAVATFRRAAQLKSDSVAGQSGLLLTLHCLDIDPQSIFAEHVTWARTFAAGLASRRPTFQPHKSPRLRIAYVSPDFWDHVVGRFIEPALAHHDRDRIEIYCYCDQRRSDEVTRRLRAHADVWRNTISLTDAQLADQIRADGIDLLIDLTGHTAENRLLVFARRAAPVQATFLGYPDTTGLVEMDWRITDAHADPPGMTESLHTEKLIRLKCAWCYQPQADTPEPQPRDPAAPVTFGSFNALAKISPAAIELWAKLLARVEGSRLLLKDGAFSDADSRERYLRAFESRGIARERIELAKSTNSFGDHLAMYDRMDVALDTFPYTGTTTTCEALGMGVPVVTLAGRTHVSRVGVSLLHAAGCSEWVALTPDEYIEIASKLAADAKQRGAFRSEARKRLRASTLMDTRGFTLDLEEAYRRICGRSI